MKPLVEEPRNAGATQIRIDKNDPLARQRRRSREGKSMSGFPLTAGRGGYAEGSARPPSAERSRFGTLDGELYIGPGKPKRLGKRGPIVS